MSQYDLDRKEKGLMNYEQQIKDLNRQLQVISVENAQLKKVQQDVDMWLKSAERCVDGSTLCEQALQYIRLARALLTNKKSEV